MKIGFHTNPRKDIFSEIKWIYENKFDFVDLFLEPDMNDIGNLNSGKLKKIISDLNIETAGHTAFYLPIGSPLKELRNSAVRIINDHTLFFSEINCTKMTIHANWPPKMFSADEGIAFQSESIEKITDFAKNCNVRIMYEPLDTKSDTLENVRKILYNNKDLYFHLDAGHANLYGRNPLDFINNFKDRLIHVHLHDNNGNEDLHNPLDTGNINWKEIIKTLSAFYKETITLEIFSKERDFVLLSKNKVKNYINELK